MEFRDNLICRVCLRKNLKFYDLESFNLRALYEDITNTTISYEVTCPQLLCYECSALLIKFHNFKERCLLAQHLLKLQSEKEQFTSQNDLDVDLLKCITKSTINYITETKRVGIFFYKEDSPGSTFLTNTSNDVLYFIPVSEITANESVETKTEVIETDYFENDPICSDSDEPLKPFKSDELGVFIHTTVKKEDELEVSKSSTKRLKRRKNKVKVKFAKQKSYGHKFDEAKWKIVTLSEEEASREFYSKTESLSYQKAEYHCTRCYKGFSNADILVRHQSIHKEFRGKYECTLCKRRYKWEARLRAHMKVHCKRYHCLLCNVVFKTATQAILHERYHEGVVYSCKLCDLKFTKASTYYTHVRVNHRSEFVCLKCGASFVSKHGLNQHKKLIHLQDNDTAIENSTDENDVADNYCSKCDLRFETNEAYSEHIYNSAMHVNNESIEENDEKIKLLKPNKHTLEKSAICKPCGKEFESAKSYKYHRRTHGCATISGQRYVCEICGASLAQGSIQQHMNSHTHARTYPCQTCGKVFRTPANRSRHLVTHTGEKPFPCKLCDKRFSQRGNVKLHVNTFHMKQPYPPRDRRRKKTQPQIFEPNQGQNNIIIANQNEQL